MANSTPTAISPITVPIVIMAVPPSTAMRSDFQIGTPGGRQKCGYVVGDDGIGDGGGGGCHATAGGPQPG